ncbi:MAG: MaoC family dehydratase N-terminal domain-containing protein [Chloroflexi bacterium]|nr:MaoC family dehydratase N-terminal domain-containing protein [Chloroflexota bacterium]
MAEPVTSEELDFDRSVLGVEVEVGMLEVTAEAIQRFNEAVGETNPIFTDADAAKAAGYRDLTAPPTFYAVIRTESGPDPKVTFGSTGFNAGQHCDFGEAVCVGDTITVNKMVADVYAKTGRTGTMVFIVSKTFYRNQFGQKVAEVEQSYVRRNM